ncbi:hypothetical protein O9G_001423 [Rozella allomycis CSF55]|uniref:Uncharacterized protein n=1 Tax=Rozella allomycis (strain CSF55) TaxID=988480 RepID=A0A075B305_ROZAC|nr:hypothetical protein O9G_001423 [Rozella allomycis CSF55]|eukprot:EPZ36978.1 hypothetical protein O9G_001423 [Rozella allomycis CSF55]
MCIAIQADLDATAEQVKEKIKQNFGQNHKNAYFQDKKFSVDLIPVETMKNEKMRSILKRNNGKAPFALVWPEDKNLSPLIQDFRNLLTEDLLLGEKLGKIKATRENEKLKAEREKEEVNEEKIGLEVENNDLSQDDISLLGSNRLEDPENMSFDAILKNIANCIKLCILEPEKVTREFIIWVMTLINQARPETGKKELEVALERKEDIIKEKEKLLHKRLDAICKSHERLAFQLFAAKFQIEHTKAVKELPGVCNAKFDFSSSINSILMHVK